MPIPSIPDLELTAKKLVWAAQKNGNLQDLTPRLIRQGIEKELALDEGVLDASEYKSAIKAATKYALDNEPPPTAGVPASKAKPPTRNKRKSDGTVKTEPEKEKDEPAIPSPQPTPKAKAKAKPNAAAKVVASEDEGAEEAPTPKKRKVASRSKKAALSDEDDDFVDDDDASPKKKPRARAVKAKEKKVVSEDEDEDEEPPSVAAAPTKPKSKKDPKAYKSLEHVPTSDMEQDEPEPVAGPSAVKTSVPAQPKQSPRKSKADSASRKPPSSKNPEAAAPTPIDAETDDVAHKSESELSVLLDDLPKPKRKSSSGDKAAKKASEKPKAKKATKASVVLSKDEETIKRLKALVVACGTRKVWSKVFQGLDSPQQQIRKLKEMLSDLGMTGRMSLEQAKAIKEKRELAQELADVTEFAAKMEARGGSSAKSKSVEPDAAAKEEKDGSSEDEEEIQAPRKRMMNARKSIMAFLDDQSDDE